MKKTNILVILCDQLRYDSLDCYGDKICDTPNIDQIANESVVFDNAYTCCPICTPARATIQTGLYPMHHGMINNIYNAGCMIQELPDRPELLGYRLQNAGYGTCYTGKWHLGSGGVPDKHSHEYSYLWPPVDKTALPSMRGYQYADDFQNHGGRGTEYQSYIDWLRKKNKKLDLRNHPITNQPCFYSGYESTAEAYLAERTCRHIDKVLGDDKPFFAMLNFWGPHAPYQALEEDVEKYLNKEIEPWPSYFDDNVNKPKIHKFKGAKKTTLEDWEKARGGMVHYYGGTELLDRAVGEVVSYLKEKDMYDDTIIIFSSDHGNGLGCHGGLGDKAQYFYDDTCRIPLLFKLDKANSVHRNESRFAGTSDLYSTILDIAGYKEDIKSDGRSLLPVVLEQETPDWNDCVVCECHGLQHKLMTQRMLRWGRWKYNFNMGDTDELYDMQDDEYEMINLIDSKSHKEIAYECRQRLGRWMIRHQDGLMLEFGNMYSDIRVTFEESCHLNDEKVVARVGGMVENKTPHLENIKWNDVKKSEGKVK